MYTEMSGSGLKSVEPRGPIALLPVDVPLRGVQPPGV